MEEISFAYSVQGASHIQSESSNDNIFKKKYPCQDRSFFGFFPENLTDKSTNISLYVKDSGSLSPLKQIPVELKAYSEAFKVLCVSDGHGSAPYFRSQKGAEFALQSFIELLSSSIDMLSDCFKKGDFRTIEKGLSVGLAHNRWVEKIVKELTINPIKPEEIDELEKELRKDIDIEKESISALNIITEYKNEIEKFSSCITEDDKIKFIRGSVLKEIFGCTFIAYVQTKSFWYALQIGDGDFAISYDGSLYEKPIPEDENCQGNETTSLCGKNSHEEFRFAHGNKLPRYVFCSSDGISNSVPSGDDGLFNFYKWVVNLFCCKEFDECSNCAKNNNINEYFCDYQCRIEKAKEYLASDLPKQSERGSKDDFSLAAIINLDESVKEKIKKLTYYRKGIQILSFDSEKANVLINKSLEWGNPLANYNEGERLLIEFEKELHVGELSLEKKRVIQERFSKAGEKGKQKTQELYHLLAEFLIKVLSTGNLKKELYDETFNNLNSNDLISSELEKAYYNYWLDQLKNGVYIEKEFSDVVLYTKKTNNEDMLEKAYSELWNYVVMCYKTNSKLYENEISNLISFYNADDLRLSEIYNFLSEILLATGKDYCNCYDYYLKKITSVNISRDKFGQINMRLYSLNKDVNLSKANKYLAIGATMCENKEACYEYGLYLFREGKNIELKGDLFEAEKYYLIAEKYLQSGKSLTHSISEYINQIGDFYLKIGQRGEASKRKKGNSFFSK